MPFATTRVIVVSQNAQWKPQRAAIHDPGTYPEFDFVAFFHAGWGSMTPRREATDNSPSLKHDRFSLHRPTPPALPLIKYSVSLGGKVGGGPVQTSS